MLKKTAWLVLGTSLSSVYDNFQWASEERYCIVLNNMLKEAIVLNNQNVLGKLDENIGNWWYIVFFKNLNCHMSNCQMVVSNIVRQWQFTFTLSRSNKRATRQPLWWACYQLFWCLCCERCFRQPSPVHIFPIFPLPKGNFFAAFLRLRVSWTGSSGWLHHVFPLALKQGGPVMKYDRIR